MIKFTLMAEYKAEPFTQWMQECVDPQVPASTYTHRHGRWEGKPEDSFTLTVLVPGSMEDRGDPTKGVLRMENALRRLGSRYCEMADQSEVWLTVEEVAVVRLNKSGVISAE